MTSHEENLRLQAEEHPLVPLNGFETVEAHVLHLIHLKAYEEVRSLASGKRVLDWGCNNGYGMEVLQSVARGVAGLDLSPAAVAEARQRFHPETPAIELYDGRQSSFESGSFDLVSSFQVIEHVSHYETYLSEITRVLKPRGCAVFTTPNGSLRLEPGMKPWNPFHQREFSPDELSDLLQNWFRKVEIRGLTGTTEICSVERSRIECAKRYAKLKQRMLWRCYDAIRPAIPRAVVKAASRLAGITEPPKTKSPTEDPPFTTADLRYTADNVGDTLDLMAVCEL